LFAVVRRRTLVKNICRPANKAPDRGLHRMGTANLCLAELVRVGGIGTAAQRTVSQAAMIARLAVCAQRRAPDQHYRTLDPTPCKRSWNGSRQRQCEYLGDIYFIAGHCALWPPSIAYRLRVALRRQRGHAYQPRSGGVLAPCVTRPGHLSWAASATSPSDRASLGLPRARSKVAKLHRERALRGRSCSRKVALRLGEVVEAPRRIGCSGPSTFSRIASARS
jgi:hypothetical protein